MIIGTVRPEEAKVFDQYAGFHAFHAEPINDPNLSPQLDSGREKYGSFEIFWHAQEDKWDDASGWYWRAGFPGCMPDGDPMGPFASSRQALEDADEWNPEFDE